MQPFKAAMLRVREAFYAALIRSLLRTKSLIQTILTIWASPKKNSSEVEAHAKDSAADDDVSEHSEIRDGPDVKGARKIEDFLDEVESLFRHPTRRRNLEAFSEGLKNQFQESLRENPQCMLPSYQHQLPTGDECGTYLALDVGGSTFRVALIELAGGKKKPTILRRSTTKIDLAVKSLQGVTFFDWMAERIDETLSGLKEGHEKESAPLSMGMAWSFPIEQTSLRSGLLQNMGKNFMAAHGILGDDLGDLIQGACTRRNLNVSLEAIVNDSSACLLSSAFTSRDLPTRLSLILGTGVNAAVHLPVASFSAQKFGVRPSSWHSVAEHVIVNTELSMFGAEFLPFTRWDKQLLAKHPRPNFQPIEHFVGGGYLGEIVRLVLIEAIETTGFLGGVIPSSLLEPYSLDTEIISRISFDTSPSQDKSIKLFNTHFPIQSYTYTKIDITHLRTISTLVTDRATSIIAGGLHALWMLQNSSPTKKTLIAYNGSVIEQYPGFRETTQKNLDLLVGAEGILELVPADDSSLLGAAVAVACLE
ncbi:hexokinase [Phlyctema vagabunda]|uniref:Phosphotransferase n=1 Tax=Phlyctema vagabunda TaxID=108571 RepID=A0ABR4PC43_9HELO